MNLVELKKRLIEKESFLIKQLKSGDTTIQSELDSVQASMELCQSSLTRQAQYAGNTYRGDLSIPKELKSVASGLK